MNILGENDDLARYVLVSRAHANCYIFQIRSYNFKLIAEGVLEHLSLQYY